MSENKVGQMSLIICLLIGIIVGAGAMYMCIPTNQKTVVETVEVFVTEPGDPVTVGELQEQTLGLTTLIYGAIGASLIAALAAIVTLMQISQRTN